jgi:CheY-specific phosphatase CheX
MNQALVLDENLKKDLIKGTHDTFMAYFNLHVSECIKSGQQNMADNMFFIDSIITVINMDQSVTEAIMRLEFPRTTLEAIASGPLGELSVIRKISINDLAGEITNCVYGMTKQYLNARGYNFQMTLPEEFMQEKEQLVKQARASGFIVEFTSSAGGFRIEVYKNSK